jgi:hypothetical protein
MQVACYEYARKFFMNLARKNFRLWISRPIWSTNCSLVGTQSENILFWGPKYVQEYFAAIPGARNGGGKVVAGSHHQVPGGVDLRAAQFQPQGGAVSLRRQARLSGGVFLSGNGRGAAEEPAQNPARARRPKRKHPLPDTNSKATSSCSYSRFGVTRFGVKRSDFKRSTKF